MKQMNEAELTKIRNRDREVAEMRRALMMRGIFMAGGVPVHHGPIKSSKA